MSSQAVEQLYLLHPDRIVPEIKAGRLLFRYSPTRGEQQMLSESDVVHVKAVTVDGLVGLSPVQQARIALGLSDSLTRHARNFFKNDARPGGIVKVPGGRATEGIQHLKAQWEGEHRGVDAAHRIAVVSGDLEFEPISIPQDDMEFVAQRKLSTVEVARIFRIPAWMVSADSGESLTYSNVESQALSFVTYSLRPWLVVIEQAISNDPDLCAERQYVEFLLDALLRADSKTRAEVYTAALNPTTGWMTRAEVRRLENLDPEDEPVATNGSGNTDNVAALAA
jgi:HK97 family phage portal protein